MAVTYTLWRSIQPGSRFPAPIQFGLPGPNFTDAAVLPGVTYYYTLTKSDTAQPGVLEVSNEASATAPVPAPVVHAKDTAMTLVFSTGTLFIDTGAGPIEFATLQDISWEMPFQEKELRTAPWLNGFSDGRAFYGGKMTLKATYATIFAAGLAAATGGTNTAPVVANPAANPPVAGAPGVMSIGSHAILPPFSAVFTTQDDAGNIITFTCKKVRTPGLTLPFKLDDYAMPNVTMIADEDATGTVGVWKFTV